MSDSGENGRLTSEGHPPNARRPNANYKLSKEKVDPEDIVYHYDRETRLAKAPRAVQALYENQPVQRFGLMRFIRGNKPKSMTFISILMCCVLMLIASYITAAGKTDNLDGNRLFIEAQKYDEVIIVTLKKRVARSVLSRTPVYTGPVNITVLPSGKADAEQNQTEVSPSLEAATLSEASFSHRIVFTRERQEQYSFVLPFDSDELLLVFQNGRKTLGVTVKPE